MNKNNVYTQNYYNLKRKTEEDDFIAGLNKAEVSELVLPILKVFKDKLYILISGTEKIKTAIPEVIENEKEINEKLTEILCANKLYRYIEDAGINNNFFTIALVKLDNRLFKKNYINDENYVLQSYIFYWLETTFAKVVLEDERFKSYNSIRKLLEKTEMLHHFYHALKNSIPDEWIQNEIDNWEEVPQEPKIILESIRTLDDDYFKGYELQLDKYKEYSPWKFIFESTRYSDHAMFSDEFSFKNSLLFERSISLWIKFWDNLKWPILQDLPFHYDLSPRSILCSAKELVKQKENLKTEPKHLAFILLKNLFDKTLKVQENLSFYINTERISSLSEYERNDEILKEGAKLYSYWEKEKKLIYKDIIHTLLEIISVEEMSEWVFSYSPRSIDGNEYNTRYNKELEILGAAFNPHIIEESFETQIQKIDKNFNFRKFVFLVSQINKNTNKTYIESLLTSITKYTRTESFYWDGTFSPAYWPTLKSIGFLLSLTEHPVSKAQKLIQDFKLIHEGWNISNSNYRFTQNESFIYCGAILLLEHNEAFKTEDERDGYYIDLVNLVISQTRFMVGKLNNDYTLPLYLLGLVANQMYPNLKNTYETAIINDLDNISTTVSILSNDDYKLLPESKSLLKTRLDIEFNIQKRQFMQRRQSSELEKFVEGINKLQISIN